MPSPFRGLLALTCTLLAACGGGGGGGSTPNPPPAPQAQVIAFATAGSVTRPLADATFTNAATGGAGTGAITYDSSNAAVATAAAGGVVTLVTAGTVTITASKAADANFRSASASYTLFITAPVASQPQSITFATAGPVSRPFADGLYTNVAAGSAGTGAITYGSSNTAVASVTADGLVIFAAAGTVVITATKAADANYLAASANYTLEITPPPVLQPQMIAFATPGTVSRPYSDNTYTNVASGGAGTGAITYSSSNNSVASVEPTGRALLASPGTVTITATKAADSVYQSATATYTLVVTPVATVKFNAWLGETGTEVAFSGNGLGLEFLRSSQLDCNVQIFSTCTGTQSSLVSALPMTDTTAKLGWPANWWLRRGSAVTAPLRINNSRFPAGERGTAVSWRNRLWIVHPAGTDVWNSDDGQHWNFVTADTGFARRAPGTTVVFNDRLWMLGGLIGDSFGADWINEIWSTGDGTTWRRDAVHAPWTGRSGHTALVFNNRLWVLGGYPSPFRPEVTDDAWSSADGINWFQETANATFLYGATFSVLNDRIFAVGGIDGSNVYQTTVYSSADGRTWRLETATAPWSGRTDMVLHTLNGKLWMIGGQDCFNNCRRGDVWSSPDGINWTLDLAMTPFAARLLSASTLHAGRLWMLGGSVADPDFGSTFSLFNDSDEVWSTADGTQWKEHSLYANGFLSGQPNVVAHAGKLWVVGGWDGAARADSTNTVDGLTWTLVPVTAGFTPRRRTSVVSFNNELWVIAGADFSAFGPTTTFADVWHSSDGASWTRATNAAPFGKRFAHAAVVFNNAIYVMGGYVDDGANTTLSSEVWRSSNGTSWTLVTATADFGTRSGMRAAVANGRIWLVGSEDIGSREVWSSADGISWRRDTANATAIPSAGFGYVVTAHDNKLWLTCGANVGDEALNTLWSSVDGATWTQVPARAQYSPRVLPSMTSYDGKLWVLGGRTRFGAFNDLWVSADGGITWKKRLSGEMAYP
ncbi:MAG TPA: hypothetical protein VK624_12330 [Steroidobacteraceae bacterium]|nr:hypothetical protein [Steroidobacteraceae bacterium]